jgi:GTP-binding protein
MKVLSAKYIKSAMRPEEYPRIGHPAFAFVGRSNVGEAALLNSLLRQKGLAKTSSTPGKTQTINFFEVNEKVFFVDLPGYGFAKVPKSLKAEWNRVMMGYLEEREPLRMVAALLDARHKPSDKDVHMLQLLEQAAVPTLLVATKVDKLKKSERSRNLNLIRKTLELGGDAMVIPFSAVTGEGTRELWEIIDEHF